MKQLILLLAVCLIHAAFGQEFVKNSVLDQPEDTKLRSLSKGTKLDALKKQLFEVDSAYVYGGGSLQSIVTNKKVDNTTPSGSLGFNFETDRITFNLFYSYNSRSVFKMDSLYKLGNSLLVPNTAGQSISLGTYCLLSDWVGINFRASISDDFWKINDSTELDASPFMFRFGLRFTPFDFKKIKTQKIGFYLDACYTHRSILGDFRNGYYEVGNQIINQGGYNGFELTANFIFGDLSLFTSYFLNPQDKYLIPGFTGSQVTFGLNLTTDIVKLK